MQAGDKIVELIQYINPKGKPYNMSECDTGNMHIAFRVTDIYKIYKTLKQKGVKFKSPPNEVIKGPTKGWIWTYFYDPDGAQLELIEQL